MRLEQESETGLIINQSVPPISVESDIDCPPSLIKDYFLFARRLIRLHIGATLEPVSVSRIEVKHPQTSDEVNGFTSQKTREIGLLLDSVDPKELFSTVLHEEGHALHFQMTKYPLLHVAKEAFAEMVRVGCMKNLQSESDPPDKPARELFGPGSKVYEYPNSQDRESDGRQLLYVMKRWGIEKAAALTSIPTLRFDPFNFGPNRYFGIKFPDHANRQTGKRLDTEVERVIGISRPELREQYERDEFRQ